MSAEQEERHGLLRRIWQLYADGFRNMTWGRTLWFVILLKLIILFAVLRVFFFRPVLAGKSDEEKSEFVGERLAGDVHGGTAGFTEAEVTDIND